MSDGDTVSRAEAILSMVEADSDRISMRQIGRIHTASGRKDLVGDAARHIKSKTGQGWPTKGGVSDAKRSFVKAVGDKAKQAMDVDISQHKDKAIAATIGAGGLAAALAAKKMRDRRRRKRQNENISAHDVADKLVGAAKATKDTVKKMPYWQRASIGAAGLGGAIAAKRAEKRWKDSREDYD